VGIFSENGIVLIWTSHDYILKVRESQHGLWLITEERNFVNSKGQDDSAVVMSMSKEDTSMVETNRITEETFSPLLDPTAIKRVWLPSFLPRY